MIVLNRFVLEGSKPRIWPRLYMYICIYINRERERVQPTISVDHESLSHNQSNKQTTKTWQLQYTSFQNCNAFNIHRTATSIAMVLRLVLLGQPWILLSAATVGPAWGFWGHMAWWWSSWISTGVCEKLFKNYLFQQEMQNYTPSIHDESSSLLFLFTGSVYVSSCAKTLICLVFLRPCWHQALRHLEKRWISVSSVDPKRPQVSLSHWQILFISTELARFSTWINILEVFHILYTCIMCK